LGEKIELKIDPSNSKPKIVAKDLANQLAQASLLAKKIRELSLISSAPAAKTLVSKLIGESTNISDLIRNLGLSDALLQSQRIAPVSHELVSLQHKLDPQLAHIARPKIQSVGGYDTSDATSVASNSKFRNTERDQKPTPLNSAHEIGILQPFLPSKEDFDHTIDDFNSLLNGADSDLDISILSRLAASENLRQNQNDQFNKSIVILVGATSATLLFLIWLIAR
jgi:hypothetical protein